MMNFDPINGYPVNNKEFRVTNLKHSFCGTRLQKECNCYQGIS